MKKIILLFLLIFLFSCSLNKEKKYKNQDFNNYIFINNWNITKKWIDFNKFEDFIKENKWLFISLSNNNINKFIKEVNILDNKNYFRLEVDKISEKNLNKILSLLWTKNIKEININILNLNNNVLLNDKVLKQINLNKNIKKIEIFFNWNWKIIFNNKFNKVNVLNLP